MLGVVRAPFVLFVLAPTTLALAAFTPARDAVGVRFRVLLAALGVILTGSVALALVANETADSVGGYRIFGIAVHGVGGILWSLIGINLPRRSATPSSADQE